MPKKKDGTKITWKEFFLLWGEGIKNLTPIQKISNELNGNIITIIGFTISLIALIIFRDKFIVSWFAYGLILVFVGNIWSLGIKAIGLYQQKRIFKDIEKQINGDDMVEVNMEDKEREGMSSLGINLDKYCEDEDEK